MSDFVGTAGAGLLSGRPSSRTSTLNPRPAGLRSLLWACDYCSRIVAFFHDVGIRSGLLRVAPCVRHAPGGLPRALREIWLSRLLRESLAFLLKTSFRPTTLRLVDDSLVRGAGKGCVIAICHTPWARLLAEWCRVHDFALVIADGPWASRMGYATGPGRGFSELRRVVRHLKAGGRVIVTADAFAGSRSSPVRFLEGERMVFLLPGRLALLAGVPLRPVVAHFADGSLHLRFGSLARTQVLSAKHFTQALLRFFEDEIRLRPAIWGDVLKNAGAA